MPLVNKAEEGRSIITEYSKDKVSMPCFCAENTFTVEGILNGASKVEAEKGKTITVYIAAMGNYYGRQQLKNYTSLDNTWEGFLAFKRDIERLCRKDGPFQNVQVIPSLDHGQPELDDELFEKGRDFWGCVVLQRHFSSRFSGG
ncbi:MAG: hypothetical protein ABIG61_05185 [Planctomycetota bacterium]